jgi:hypothetical protein
MGHSRLNGLALMNIHRDIPLSIEQLIDALIEFFFV